MPAFSQSAVGAKSGLEDPDGRGAGDQSCSSVGHERQDEWVRSGIKWVKSPQQATSETWILFSNDFGHKWFMW
jgi:hypothetical protein